MRILISNDDGIKARGIHSLALAMKRLGDVYVVAPATQQTAKGHSVSIDTEIKVQKRDFEEGITAYAVWGTPKDCIDLAVDALLGFKPDLIVTGINEGPNLCNDSVSSGTVGGAIAGYNNGIPSIATSLDFGKKYDYDKCAKVAVEVARWFMSLPYKNEFALSINFPNMAEDFKGIVVAGSGGKHTYDAHYEISRKEDDFVYYIIPGGHVQRENVIEDLDHDMHALEQGYVVLSPLDDDLIYEEALPKLRKDWNKHVK